MARPDRLTRVADLFSTAVGRLTVDPGTAARQMASLLFSWVPRGGRAGLLPSQPWTRILFPHEITDNLFGPLISDAASAAAIPAVARGVQIYTGALKQMPMDAYRGTVLQSRPRLLDQPDPNAPAGWFVGVQVEDYLYNGNALNVITAYGPGGWPAASTWLPAAWCSIGWHPNTPGAVQYLVDGVEIPAERVVHIRRGADRTCPVRGVGIVEQHLRSLERIAGEEAYEQQTLSTAAVPSVAVISPNPGLSNDEATEAKSDWLTKYGGPRREPAILPAGTEVIPLSWSPDDAQLTEARRMSLLDVANILNLDGYYLGAPNASLTYAAPGANFSNLLRLSLEPVLKDFEDVWSMMWLPRGQRVRFDRLQLTRDDFAATIDTLATAVDAGILTVDEARTYLGLAAGAGDPSLLAPTDTEQIPA